MKKTQGFGLVALLVILALVIAGGGAFFYFQNQPSITAPNVQVGASSSQTQTPHENTQQISSTSNPPTHTVLIASPTTGTAPLSVAFVTDNHGGNIVIDFGDGTLGPVSQFEDTAPAKYQISFAHTYTATGSHTVTLHDASNNFLGKTVITVTGGSTSNTLTATIDQSSVVKQPTGNFTLYVSGKESGMEGFYAVVVDSSYSGPTDETSLTDLVETGQYNARPPNDGGVGVNVWKTMFTDVPAGTYRIYLFSTIPDTFLASSTLTVVQ